MKNVQKLVLWNLSRSSYWDPGDMIYFEFDNINNQDQHLDNKG